MELTVESISEKSGKSVEEVQKILEAKKEKFSGLLDEKSALFMVSKELGVGSGEGGATADIASLKGGDQNLNLDVAVKQVFTPRKFDKGGRKGTLMSLIVADASGETRLTLWNDDVKKFLDSGVERGQGLALRDCYVKTWNEKPQLNLSFNGTFEIVAKPEGIEVESNIVKLSDLKEGLNNVDVYARVLRKFEQRTFEKDGKEGAVMNFELGDDTGAVRGTAWNEVIDEVVKVKDGDAVKIEGGYTKEGMRGIELHLGWQARVLAAPKGVELPPASEMVSAGKAIEKMGIKDLKEGVYAEVKGKVSDVRQGSMHYLVCPECGKKVERLDSGFVCGAHGEVEKPDAKLVVGFELNEDGGVGVGASIACVVFGTEGEKVLGRSTEQVMAAIDTEGVESAFEFLKGKVVGKEISVQGRAKVNERSGMLEFVGNKVIVQ